MSSGGFGVVRGGQLLDLDTRSLRPADILIDGDTIKEIGPPGLDARPAIEG